MNEINLTSQRNAWRSAFWGTWLCVVLLLCALGCDNKGAVKKSGPDASSSQKSSESGSSTKTQETAIEPGSSKKTNDEVTDLKPGDEQVVTDVTDEAPAKSGETENAGLISFDDLNLGMQVDVLFRPLFLKSNQGRVKELLGKRVVVAGYMDPTDSQSGVKEFILLRNLECKFGPGGQADHLVRVYLAEDQTTSFTNKVVYVEGKLVLNPFPADPQAPITWSIYDMEDSKVSTRRPR